MSAHTLGGYTFDYDTKNMSIPEKIKPVSTVNTYTGSAIFQWPALIKGSEVTYFWNVMPVDQYNSLKALYESPDTISWNPQYLGVYQVIVTKFKGQYMDVALNEQPYRVDVELTLNIRSGPV